MKNKLNLTLISTIVLSACASEEAGTGLSLSILPVIDAATPTALQVSALKSNLNLNSFVQISPFADADSTAVKTGIDYLFDTTYPNISGDSVKGFFRSAITVIDSRAATEGAGMAASNPDQCKNGTAYSPSVTALPTDANIILYPACTKIFTTGGSNVAGDGSGYSYGETTETDGTTTVTSWLTLVQSNGIDKFSMMGKITNASAATADEKGTEVMFMEAGPASGSWNRHTMYHIKATPSTNKIEIAMASTSAGVMQAPTATSDVTGFGCGMQMISDGTFIRAKGRQVLTGTCTAVTDGDFDVCLSATDGTLADASSCTSLTFTMTALTSAMFDSTTQTEMAAALMVGAATSANDISE